MENVSRLRARDSVSTSKFPGDEKEGLMWQSIPPILNVPGVGQTPARLKLA
jgi:hypothetical protein